MPNQGLKDWSKDILDAASSDRELVESEYVSYVDFLRELITRSN